METADVWAAAYNTDKVKKEDLPKSYENLQDPKWQGRQGVEAEDQGWFGTLIGALGKERGLKLFTHIVDSNGISVRKGHSLLANLVASGEVPMALSAYNWSVGQIKAKAKAKGGDAPIGILSLLCGGLARSVRARSFNLDAQRSTIGAHAVWIDFANGSAATAIYNGYGRFSSMDLCGDISEWGLRQPPQSRPRLANMQGLSAQQELHAKQQRARSAIPAQAPHQPFFGLTLVSCQHGDLRQSPDGLLLYGDEGVREIALSPERSPRELVLDEFHAAIAGQCPPLHDGRWGLATLEICVAALQSAATGAQVPLHEQVAVRTQV